VPTVKILIQESVGLDSREMPKRRGMLGDICKGVFNKVVSFEEDGTLAV
jgi:hypothetical protein